MVLVVAIFLIVQDTSPSGSSGRTVGIVLLGVCSCFGLTYALYATSVSVRDAKLAARSAYVAPVTQCELCKRDLAGPCSLSHEWERKQRLEELGAEARAKIMARGDTPEFARSLCPLATGKCGT